MLWCWLLASSVVHLVLAHEHAKQVEQLPPKGKEGGPVEDIRKRWSAADVIHDLEHIKEDLHNLIILEGSGDITKDEASFYYFRMHDFDGNNLLDGQEIMAGIRHSLGHNRKDAEIGIERVVALTDESLEYDNDNDGFISYPEMRVYVQEKIH